LRVVKAKAPCNGMAGISPLSPAPSPPCVYSNRDSDACATLTLGDQTIMAKTDGSLQIKIPDTQNPGRVINWNRQYYAVPLEVRPHPIRVSSHLPIPVPVRVPYPRAHPCSVLGPYSYPGKTFLPRSQRKGSPRNNRLQTLRLRRPGLR